MTTTTTIAIIGAGLGGLACARVLQQHGIPVTVYEGESSPTARGQGGTLDMHVDTGQVALRTAGLFDAFRALARPEGQQQRALDPVTGAVLVEELPADGEFDRPEIDRGDLRRLLLDSLAPGTVHWGRPVLAVTPLGGAARIDFVDGSTATATLVVGADGAWSRVRAALTGVLPDYTGVTFVECWLDDCDTRHRAVADLVGAGTMLAKVPGTALVAQRNDNGHIRVYAAMRAPRDWHAGLDLTDTAAVRAHLLERYHGWHDGLLDLLVRADSGFTDRPLYALPVPHAWTTVPSLTLLGDAAHLMPPLGVGANLALLDGTELATALATAPDVEAAVRAYETTMLPRSIETAFAVGEGLGHLMDEPVAV